MDQDTTGQVRSVDVATLLASIANQLSQNRGQLDQVDRQGTHGERIAQAFTVAAQAAENTGGDAGTQLQAAAEAMKAQGSGKAAQFYADGLLSAADQFAGQSSISADNLGSFLKSFVGGVGQNNPAKPGQGTMLDALNPALSALTSARGQGQDTIGAMSSALGAAITGTQRTAGTAGRVDPGAASATNVLGGIFAALAPTLLNTILNRVTGGQSSAGGAGGLGGLLGGLFGGATGGSGSMQSQGNTGNPLGGLLGGSDGSSSTGQSGAGTDWVGGLLGGLMGGGQGTSAGGSGLSGDALGGLLRTPNKT
jgi:DAK2 domain